MLYEGYVVPPFYDSLLGKLIVGRRERGRRRSRRLRSALRRPSIEGLATTRGPASCLLDNERRSKSGAVHTRWLEDWLALEATDDRPGRLRAPEEGWGWRPDIRSVATSTSSSRSTRKCRSTLSSNRLSMTNAVRESRIKGVTEICPANASLSNPLRPGCDQSRRHACRTQAPRIGGRKERSERCRRGSSKYPYTTTIPGHTRR